MGNLQQVPLYFCLVLGVEKDLYATLTPFEKGLWMHYG